MVGVKVQKDDGIAPLLNMLPGDTASVCERERERRRERQRETERETETETQRETETETQTDRQTDRQGPRERDERSSSSARR
jgi:hypothetical protein